MDVQKYNSNSAVTAAHHRELHQNIFECEKMNIAYHLILSFVQQRETQIYLNAKDYN